MCIYDFRLHRGVGGYTPNSVYTTRTQYRSQMYPTFSQRSHSPANQGGPDYDNIQQSNRYGNINVMSSGGLHFTV